MPLPRAILICAAAIIVGVVLPSGCAARPRHLHRFEFSEIVMGVEARLVLFAEDRVPARQAARTAFDRLAELDGVMSDYRSKSELMQVTALANERPGEPIPVSVDLFRVLDRAQAIAEASDGAFDITVGPAVTLWRQARRNGALPKREAIDAALLRVGWQNLSLHPRSQAVSFRRDGLRLDLGGIGKGYAAEEAMRTLVRSGTPRCLVDLGGDLVLGAAPPGETGWRIDLDTGDHRRSLILAHTTVATSGDTEQFVEIDGVRYSHIVNPRTGLGLTGRIAVTVIAPDGATADALASAISVLGEADGRALASRFSGVRVFIAHLTAHPPH